eukprot:410949-Pyramimonas_sp.AAC.1
MQRLKSSKPQAGFDEDLPKSEGHADGPALRGDSQPAGAPENGVPPPEDAPIRSKKNRKPTLRLMPLSPVYRTPGRSRAS